MVPWHSTLKLFVCQIVKLLFYEICLVLFYLMLVCCLVGWLQWNHSRELYCDINIDIKFIFCIDVLIYT